MIVGPCTVVTGGPEPLVYDNAAVRVVGSHIANISTLGDLAAAYPDETLWPARGRVLMPGFVNTHAHLARHLSRGLGLRTPAEWQRYDRALSAEDVAWAVQAALVEGVRHGVTTVVDFHRSGACLDLSLTEVITAAEKVGVRVATCYGAAEDDTPLERRAAIDECVGFARDLERTGRGRLRGMLGVQATTLQGIETLLAEAMESAGGLAVHVDLALDLTPAERWGGRESLEAALLRCEELRKAAESEADKKKKGELRKEAHDLEAKSKRSRKHLEGLERDQRAPFTLNRTSYADELVPKVEQVKKQRAEIGSANDEVAMLTDAPVVMKHGPVVDCGAGL